MANHSQDSLIWGILCSEIHCTGDHCFDFELHLSRFGQYSLVRLLLTLYKLKKVPGKPCKVLNIRMIVA